MRAELSLCGRRIDAENGTRFKFVSSILSVSNTRKARPDALTRRRTASSHEASNLTNEQPVERSKPSAPNEVSRTVHPAIAWPSRLALPCLATVEIQLACR